LKEYFSDRLESRYFGPIKTLKKHDRFAGEGFSIVAILCGLVEFLESTVQGKNYRYLSQQERRTGVRVGEFEYSDSADMFKHFLCTRAPFAMVCDEDIALEFYKSIRCGLLHEAQTKNGWRIRAKSLDGTFLDLRGKVVFRDDFHEAILAFTRQYGDELIRRGELQAAFVRKIDYLAEEGGRA